MLFATRISCAAVLNVATMIRDGMRPVTLSITVTDAPRLLVPSHSSSAGRYFAVRNSASANALSSLTRGRE